MLVRLCGMSIGGGFCIVGDGYDTRLWCYSVSGNGGMGYGMVG